MTRIPAGAVFGEPTSYASARILASAAPVEAYVRWHHAERLTPDRVRQPDFFDDEISRAIRTTEEIGPA